MLKNRGYRSKAAIYSTRAPFPPPFSPLGLRSLSPLLHSSFVLAGLGLRPGLYGRRKTLTLLLFRRYIFPSLHRGTLLFGASRLLLLTPLVPPAATLYQSLRSRPRRGGKPAESPPPGDFVDCNKCVCSSRRYRASSGPSFIPRSSPACPPRPAVIILL